MICTSDPLENMDAVERLILGNIDVTDGGRDLYAREVEALELHRSNLKEIEKLRDGLLHDENEKLKSTKVYAVLQNPDKRIRGIFTTKEKAEEFIGPPPMAIKQCKECGSKTNVRIHSEDWRREKLVIKKHVLQ